MLAQETLTLAMPLTSQERSAFAQCETVIAKNLQTLFDVGRAFVQIRDAKLYRETHKTFEDYCINRWKISRPRAYQLIDASVVQENLSTIVDKNIPLPTNEAQTRALKKVAPEKQPELWSKAVARNNGNPPTAKQVIKVIETEFEKKKPKYIPQIDSNIERNLPPKPTPTPSQFKTIIKSFMGVEFADFSEAFQELGHLCNCWQSRQPYIDLVNRLKTTIEFSYTLPEFHFTVLDACHAAYNDWEELYNSGYRGADKPEVKPQPEIPQVEEPEVESHELKSCQDCYYEKTGGRKMIGWSIDEVICNEFGKRPRPGADRWPAEYCSGFSPRVEQQQASGAWCSFCQQDFPKEKLYWSNNTAICRQCAAKAQIELLHPDDPEVLAECQQLEQECIHDFHARRTRDLDKILQTGTLKILYVSEHEKIIKQYTQASTTTAEVDEITWGSWKVFEKFETKKAMMQRVKELEQNQHIIFDGQV